MSSPDRTVRIVYSARGRDVLAWFIRTGFFSVITLGLYLPVAANKLARYMCEHTVIYIEEAQSPLAEEQT